MAESGVRDERPVVVFVLFTLNQVDAEDSLAPCLSGYPFPSEWIRADSHMADCVINISLE